MKKKNLLIINYGFIIGGAETFITKIFPKFTDQYNVYILILSNNVNENLLKSLPSDISIIRFSKIIPFLLKILFNKINIDIFYSTLPQCFIFSLFCYFLSKNNLKQKLIVSPHQTESFCAKSNFFQVHRKITQYAIKKIPLENFIFLNNAGRDFHQHRLNHDFSKSNVVKLYVDINKFDFFDRSELMKNKIISIGRLAPYKTYNIQLLPIFKKLYDEGSDVEWHIYGDGELKSKMEKIISDYQIRNVFLKGSLNYSEMNSILRKYFLFIGSGTSLIEASSSGMPSITTIESSKHSDSYGFLFNIKGNCFIEPNLNIKKHDIYSLIKKAISCDDKMYSEMQIKSRKKALEFSVDIIQDYKKIFRATSSLNFSKILCFIIFSIYIFFSLINFMTIKK
jgi:glycosyltransferase involved in cell wall biosynthesis